MPDSQAIKVCFLTRDIGLADAIARASGRGIRNHRQQRITV